MVMQINIKITGFGVQCAIDDKNFLHRSQAHDCQPLLIEEVGHGNCFGGAQGIFVIDGTFYTM